MTEPRGFRATTERETLDGHDVAVVIGVGELDLAVADEFTQALTFGEEDAAAAVVVDLQELKFMDSSGLRALIVAGRDFEDGGVPYALVVATGSQPDRLLDLSAVGEQLPLAATREEALGDIRSRLEGER